MFNHHLFDGPQGVSVYEQFLKDGKNSLALVMDPPFGGKVEVISHNLKTIDADYKRINGDSAMDISSNLPIYDVVEIIYFEFNFYHAEFWIFPYFMESQIVMQFPDFAMLDYKIEYANHSQFQKGNC